MVRISQAKRPLGRAKHKSEVNIKTNDFINSVRIYTLFIWLRIQFSEGVL
jgi:hypothetical protein